MDDEVAVWKNSHIKLLIMKRISMEKEFNAGKKKKITLWRTLLSEIKEIDPFFDFEVGDTKKKFENLMTTYKRIKKRNKESGREATLWEYFEMFDQAYGGRHSVSPPKNLLCSTSSFTTERDTVSSVDPEIELEDEIASETPTKSKRKKENELLAFLKKESDKDDLKHQELVAIEKEKMELDKRRLELIKSLQQSLTNLSN